MVVDDIKTETLGTGKMAPWIKALATKPGDLSSIPGTHMVGEDGFP